MENNKFENYNEIKKSSIVFLATTSLEDFWDTSLPMVFLGEWCRRYSRRDFWSLSGENILPFPLNDSEIFHEAYYYITEIYEQILPQLSSYLNKIHGKEFSNRYWRILIGPWLIQYLEVMYDRYMSIRGALNHNDRVITIGLSDDSFVTPIDTLDFHILVSEDLYNLQFYTKILKQLGIDCPRKTLCNHRKTESYFMDYSSSSWLKRWAKKIIENVYSKLMNGKPIILVYSSFSRIQELKIFIKTKGKVIPFYRGEVKIPSCPVNKSVREKLKDIQISKSEFTGILLKLLPFDIPQCYVESFNFVEEKAFIHYPSFPKYILSAVAWYFNEGFKFWAAAAAENGTKLIGIQHGVNYNVCNYLRDDHEYKIVDRFYSWGLKSFDVPVEVKPMPAPYLMGRKNGGASNRKEEILFVTTSFPRYTYRLIKIHPGEFLNCFEWQRRFVSSMQPSIREKMRVRLFFHDYGWDFEKQWEDHYPEISIEKCNIPFFKSLMSCKIYVCDHMGNTYCEALAAKIPTILLWNSKQYVIKAELIPFFDELRNVKILHDTPESAADIVNLIYNDVESWWNEPERQEIVERFLDHFAMTSPEASNIWADELNQLIKFVSDK